MRARLCAGVRARACARVFARKRSKLACTGPAVGNAGVSATSRVDRWNRAVVASDGGAGVRRAAVRFHPSGPGAIAVVVIAPALWASLWELAAEAASS